MTERDLGDAAAGIGAFATVLGYLPEIAAVLAIIWTVIRIFEWARVRVLKLDDKETFK